ncbi:MAG TPA: hypothetical protein VFD94_05425 [Jatrophihabitans sp.]|nr:hypothetical protein [Jatrophihabitans sp.]
MRGTALLAVLPVAVRIATAELADWWPLWGAVAVLVVVVVVAYQTRRAYLTRKADLAGNTIPIGNSYPTGDGYFLTREAYLARNALNAPDWSGLTPVRGLVAGVLLLAFLLSLPPAARHEHNTWLALVSGMLLWASALTVLRPAIGIDSGCAPFFLSGSAGGEIALLAGVGVLRDGGLLVGVSLLLLGMGAALFGLAMLLLDDGWDAPRRGKALKMGLPFAVALLLVGTSLLLFGVNLLRDGDIALGIVVLWCGLTPGGIGISVLVVRLDTRREARRDARRYGSGSG